MNTETLSLAPLYIRFKDTGGYCTPPGRAACALSKARALKRWQLAEAAGRVRLRAEPEQDNYFDVYGEPTDKERKAIAEQIERDGCWFVIAEYLCSACGQWRVGGSIGMCIYADPLDPFQNDYVADLMSETLDKLN